MLTGMPQAQILAKTGVPTDAINLAAAIGRQAGVANNPRVALRFLSGRGRFIAHLHDGHDKIGHFVVVNGLDDAGRVLISDPAGLGSTYKMTSNEFIRVWNLEVVF